MLHPLQDIHSIHLFSFHKDRWEQIIFNGFDLYHIPIRFTRTGNHYQAQTYKNDV